MVLMRPAMVAGAISGVASGLALGAMTGPAGLGLGLVLGLAVGAVAGRVIEKEDARRDHRTRELDAVIGVTTGDMSAGPIHHESKAEVERWAAERLTPPPPAVT